MPMSKKETIYSRWEVADEDKKRRIFNEFKLKYRGCFTEKDLLSFLEEGVQNSVSVNLKLI
ncbi:MAG: hypothetical protein VR65_15055 [Desulfobulbaceae bacterium BRH_c16a]|nr:MAG: hypothetical protein VR65_15055 [Desulfobulbaceae bacterium BRH_c16a]